MNARMALLTDLYIFGDSAYKRKSNMNTYINRRILPAGFEQWNNAMKSVRISIEWNYGYTASLFRYVGNTDKLKVMDSDTVSKVYIVATIMRNFHVILYGCQTSNYFDLTFKDRWSWLSHYVHQTNVN